MMSKRPLPFCFHLENALFLEDPHHDRRPRAHVVRLHLVDELGRQRVFDLVGDRIERILATGQSQEQNRQEAQRTDRFHRVSWTLQLPVLGHSDRFGSNLRPGFSTQY